MARVTVMPMNGEVRRDERLGSLRGCHAITERQAVLTFAPGAMHVAIEAAVKELMLADRHLAFGGKMTFIVEVQLD